MSSAAVSLAAELRSAASRMALVDDIAETDAPHEVLYAVANTIGALSHPVAALCRRAAEQPGTSAATVAELATCERALDEAAAKVRLAMDCFRNR